MLVALFAGLDDAQVTWSLLRVPRDLALPPGDVDVLVLPGDRAAFDAAARAEGFVPVPGWERWPALQYVAFDRSTARFVLLDVTDRVAFGRRLELTTDVAAGVLARRVRRAGMTVPSPDDEFWLLLLHCLLDKGRIPEHYRDRLAAGARDASLGGEAARMVDERAGGDATIGADALRSLAVAADWSRLQALAGVLDRRWSRAVPRSRRLTGPLRHLVRTAGRGALLPRRRGVSVALLGTNGAGKSTLSAGIAAVFPLPVSAVYMGLWKDAHAGASVARQVWAAATRPVRAWSRFTSALLLQARGHLVVFDRFIYDVRRPPTPPFVLAKRVYFWLLARTCGHPDITVLLDLPGAVAFGRKGEDGVEETELERQQFLALGRELGLHVVDATQDVDTVRAEVLALVWSAYQRRWAGRALEGATGQAPGAAMAELPSAGAGITDLAS